ncbi:MAG: hypothetical protein H6706_23635 [Myxococcales bacterium]|nr:hypothetical protein [Myxococcales bacterium]
MRALLPVALCLGACTNEVEPPKAPNMSALVARYTQIDGELTPETAPRLLEASAAKLGFLADTEELLGLIEAVATGIANLDDATVKQEDGLAARAQPLTAAGVTIEAGAWAIYRRVCPGTGAEARPSRGKLSLTLLLTDDGFEPVVWGGLAQCLLASALRMDGDIRLRVDGLPAGITGVLVDFEGQLSQEGAPWERLRFDARYVPGEGVLTAVDVPDGGTFLVGYGFDGGVRVVDAQGPWRCDTSVCVGPDGQRVPW